MRSLVTAVRTLTLIPMPGRDTDSFARSLPWFPAVGAVLGFASWGAAWLLRAWPEAAALAAVATLAVFTRGLHLDGLADWADSLGILRDRARALEVMKDPRTGSFAVIALVLVLLTKWAAIARLAQAGAAEWIVAAVVVSRWAQVEMAVSLPYARAEGGTASAFVAEAKLSHRLLALVTAAAIMGSLFGVSGALAMSVGWICCTVFGAWCRRRYGGATGDLLGACSELVETALLLGAAGAWAKLDALPAGLLH